MKESIWGAAIIVAGVIGIGLIILLIRLTVNDQNDYYSLKEVTEASMIDAIDVDYYRYHGQFRIVRERFVESFIRRWSKAATDGNDVKIYINDVIEMPPKVSVTVETGKANMTLTYRDTQMQDIVVNHIDGILETLK